EAEALVRVARQSGRCLMVGHLLLYHPAVVKMKHLVTSGDVGEPFYLYSQRLNLGRVRNDENALWSFGPHDVAVAVHLFDAEPEVVTAKGEAYLQPGIVDVVFVTLHFPQRKMAHIHLSWLDPHKTRRTTLVGSRKMVVFDDMEPNDKIRIYDKGVDVRPQAVSYEDYLHVRFGDILIPHFGTTEPLRLECQHFLDCVRTGATPLSDGAHGLRVVRILAAAQKSLERDGAPVVFTNVINPRSHISRKHEYRATLVRQGATVGANATILCGLTIGRFAFVGAGTVVTRDVPDFALVTGNPGRQQGWMCRCGI